MVEQYRDKAKLWGEGYAMIEKASELLKDVLDPYSDRVSVDWDRMEDEHGQSLYTMTLRYPPEMVQKSFTPEELQAPSDLWRPFSRLWQDLLRAREGRLWKELRALDDKEE